MSDDERYMPCPVCAGCGKVWADWPAGEVQADCPYCGGAGKALKKAVERDGLA